MERAPLRPRGKRSHRLLGRRILAILLIGGVIVAPLPPLAVAQAPMANGTVPAGPALAPPSATFPSPPPSQALNSPYGATNPYAPPAYQPPPAVNVPNGGSVGQAGGTVVSQGVAVQGGAAGAAPGQGQLITMDEARRLIDEALKARDEKKKADDEKKKAENPAWSAVGSNLNLSAHWRNGVWIESPNKDFTFHLGGAVQYDLSTYTADPNLSFGTHGVGPFDDGVNLRRGRLRAEGTMWEVIDYRFELEFFNGVLPRAAPQNNSLTAQNQAFATPGPTDAWMTITKLPIIGNVRIGNQKEPMSLEHLESFRFLPFLERSPLFDFLTPTAFNNGFTPGILLFNSVLDDRMTWAIGGFKNSYDVYGFGLGDGQYAVTGRLTALPWYEQDGAYMLHLGISGSHRDPIDDQVRFRVRTSDRNAPAPLTPFVNVLVDTGFFNIRNENLMGLELFMNLGHLTLQAEYQSSWCTDSSTATSGPLGTTFFQGYYVQALYWLTGEHTNWDKKAAAPDRYSVYNPFFLIPGANGWLHGTGAWQLAARWSYVDLNSRGINGGTLGDLTLGVNWILNPNTKLQWNYDFEHRGGFDTANNGDLHAFGMRMQFDF